MTTMSRKARSAHTLLELMICIPAVTLLFLGMAAAIHLAQRAIPDGNSVTSGIVLAGAALDQLAAELACATSIPSRSATDITFVTPDRNSDTVAETIRYQWSGAVGGPLTRQVNGGTPETLLPSVASFTLTYDVALNGSGQQILRGANLSLTVPASGLGRLDARVETLNEPLFP